MKKPMMRDQRLNVYLSKSELDEAKGMAERMGIPLGVIARATLLEAARKQLEGKS